MDRDTIDIPLPFPFEIKLSNGDRLIFESDLVKLVRKDFSVPHIIGYEHLVRLIEAR